MNLARHCELCDQQLSSLKEGSVCALTNHKPCFVNICSKIELNEKFENKLKTININYYKVKKAKTLTYIYFATFIIIGIGVIIGGYLLGKYALDSGVISTVPIIIMGVGLAPLGMAFGALNKYRQENEIATINKDKIDEVLEKYNIQYDIDIKFGEAFHGTQEVYADLHLKH